MYDPFLAGLGLAFNQRVFALMCMACGHAVIPAEVKAHLRNQHGDAHITVNNAKLFEACERLGVRDTLPAFGDGPFKEVEGLALHSGITCLHCRKALIKPSSMSKHYTHAHQEIRPIPKRWPTAWVQRFSLSAGSAYFAVIPLSWTAPTEASTTIEELRSEMLEATKDRERATDARTISPWLLTTKWHEHVKGHDVGELCDLVAFPKGDIPGLQEAVLYLMRGAVVKIDSFPDLILQHLNTSDPAKT